VASHVVPNIYAVREKSKPLARFCHNFIERRQFETRSVKQSATNWP